VTNHIKPKYIDLNDSYIDGQIDFRTAEPIDDDGKNRLPMEFRDTQVTGLRIRLGKRRHAWSFFHEWSDHGERKYSNTPLGSYHRGDVAPGAVMGGRTGPSLTRGGIYIGAEKSLIRADDHMSVEAARDRAKVMTAHVITGSLPPSKNTGVKFGEAFEAYMVYLEAKAASKGKPPRWARNVRYLANQMILPQWKNWTLAEMSERPDALADWHESMVKKHKAVSANHAARIVRAVYRRRAKRDLTISKVNLPTAAIDFAPQRRRAKGEGGMAPADFPGWFKMWGVLPPIRRSYHLTNLLIGARPGELAQTKWGDIDETDNTLMIGGGNLKTGNYVSVPLTPEIREAIAIVGERGDDDAFIWPGCSQASRDELSATGMDLRRTYKTIATGLCKVAPDVSEYLMGHAPDGIGPRYILRWVIQNAENFKEAQGKISATVMRLLRAATTEKWAA
jgi:hypothetical protein